MPVLSESDRRAKLQRLCEIEGFESTEALFAAAVSDSIFVVGLDSFHSLWSNQFLTANGGSWEGWAASGGQLLAAAPGAIREKLYVLGRDTSNGVWWYGPDDNGWLPANAVTIGSPAAGPR